MSKKEPTIFESAIGKLRISRMGALTVLIVDGQGLALCLTADFAPVEKWAKSKPAMPNAMISMTKMLEKIDVMITRPGTTFGSTRGSIKPLEQIVKAMRAAGLDSKEFQLPPELKDVKPSDPVAEAKEAAEKKKAAEEKKAGPAAANMPFAGNSENNT